MSLFFGFPSLKGQVSLLCPTLALQNPQTSACERAATRAAHGVVLSALDLICRRESFVPEPADGGKRHS